jgi:CheY-like chemotaxis protein
MLPRFSGVEVLKAVRDNPRLQSIPIVIFSSNLETAQESVLGLADKSLLKGNCSFTTMLQTIQDLLAATS